MQFLAAAILSGLIQIVSTLVGRALVSLGISVATYTGVSVALTTFKNNAVNALFDLPPDVIGMLSILKVGVFISIIISAIAARLVLKGLTGGSIKKWVTK